MYEERVICQMFAHTDPPPESKRHMTFLVRFFGAWQQFTILAKMSFWPELIDTVTEYCPVTIAMPYVGYAYRAFWNEHALVPVVFFRCVRDSDRESGPPAKNFSDNCPHVRKARSVGKCRETRTADDGIKFGLRLVLYLGEGHHRNRPP
jgi:hypothetical protein